MDMFEDTRPLKKIRSGKQVFGGVCAGFAYASGINVIIIRIVAIALMAVFSPPAVVIFYVVAAVILPEWTDLPEDYAYRAEES